MRTFIICMCAMLVWPRCLAAQDDWFAADKAKHFAVGTAVSGGSYAVATPLTKRTRWRVTIATTAGVSAAAGKELRDRRRGGGSWRDFAWTAGGTATGTLIAWVIDKATD